MLKLSPTLQGEDYKTFDLLFILPKRGIVETPWDETLDPYLEEVWSFEDGENKISQIYLIK